MAIQQRFCVNHPQRSAIGVCVMTRKPICGECSTRYQGVNYSKEGLELLRKERQDAQPAWQRILAVLCWLLSPLMMYLVYLAYRSSAEILTYFVHAEL